MAAHKRPAVHVGAGGRGGETLAGTMSNAGGGWRPESAPEGVGLSRRLEEELAKGGQAQRNASARALGVGVFFVRELWAIGLVRRSGRHLSQALGLAATMGLGFDQIIADHHPDAGASLGFLSDLLAPRVGTPGPGPEVGLVSRSPSRLILMLWRPNTHY